MRMQVALPFQSPLTITYPAVNRRGIRLEMEIWDESDRCMAKRVFRLITLLGWQPVLLPVGQTT